MRGRLTVAVGVLVALALLPAAPAGATIASVVSNTATPVNCAVQSGGFRLCDETIAPAGARSTVETFDNVPIDVRVAFPPAPASGPDGAYPLLMMFHGWGGSKLPLSDMQPWLNAGYATFSMTDRGFGESCGTAASRAAAGPKCDSGYIHVMDTRYEVRDAQELAGLLADEGRTSPTRIGATGSSYGGGLSFALGALKDRKILPDGSLVPWASPLGTPMRIAAAAPDVPWSDLAYALQPNGTLIDYLADAPYAGRSGVLKQSWENAVYNAGLTFNFAPAGADPDADFRNWHTLWNAGEPYDDANGNPLAAMADLRDELSTHHSPYSIDHSEAPAPLLISNGWADDLLPVDEGLRYYNRTRTQYPSTDISLFLSNLGHQRAQNKAADVAALTTAQHDWLDYYVKGVGSPPFKGVHALTQTCPDSAPSGGPFTAADWAHMAPGEVRLDGAAAKTIVPGAGDDAIAAAFDPIGGGGFACATAPGADQPNTATYRTAAVPAGGFTLIGAATVEADISAPGSNSQIAARLLDVDTSGNELLVARGLWRPAIGASSVRQVFQLYPSAYLFAPGHVAKLELLPKDPQYGRISNGQQNVTVSNLQLRLPVREPPGSLGGLVQSPAPKFVPAGRQLARDYMANTPYPRPKAATPLYASLVPAYGVCGTPNRAHAAPLTFGSCSPPAQASPNLTVGTPDANARTANFVGHLKLHPIAGNPATEADAGIDVSLSDVRNAGSLTDYTGQLQARVAVRLTDRVTGPGGNEPATVGDFDFPVTVPCAATGDPDTGAGCSVSTTFDAVIPGAVQEGSRGVWQLGQIAVYDGGADGLVSTVPNAVFARQGVFVP